jgi:predicted component of type VI protein secretion system
MSYEERLFLEACGASGPLRFEVTDPTMAEVRSQEVEQPTLVVGSDPAADLVLDDSSVEPFHALFQVIEGRLFAVDLESATGLRWGEIPRTAGWVNRGQPLRIGRYLIRLVGGDREEEKSLVQPAPTSSRFVSRVNPPGVSVEFRLATASTGKPDHRDVLDRVLVLAGRSERCKLRVQGQSVAKFICALIRTAEGLWMTNILPSQGATVNGAFCRCARLEDEDVIQLGNFNVRVTYNDTAHTPNPRASNGHATASLSPASRHRGIDHTIMPADEASPDVLLRPLLELAGSELEPNSSPFGQALMMMVRLLGDVHRDHLSLVRDELTEIRRLSQEMARLRSETPQDQPRQLLFTNGEASNGASRAPENTARFEYPPRPHPEAVPELIADRLEAWERERQSRWRKILNVLTRD